MQFYSSIHSNYHHIFPLNMQQLHFVLEELPDIKRRNILDIGCATGDLAAELSKNACHVNAIDLDENMIELARNKHNNSTVKFELANMLRLQDKFPPSFFDGITCFGNTLVHLQNKQLVSSFLKSAHTVLKKNGLLMIQILNYEYILNEKIETLPLIDNAYITFHRNYQFLANGRINFKTKLIVKADASVLENEVLLYPLAKNELEELLIDAGFDKTNMYSGFDKTPLSTGKLPLVAVARK